VCFVENNFSSCLSAWYRCDAGKWTVDHSLAADEGASCAGSPIDSCSHEGNPDCNTAPTSEYCTCGSDGLWHCACACYGGDTTCPLACPAELPAQGVGGTLCGGIGAKCTYSGHTCTCTADPNSPGNGYFVCN
jgi:hypothetical protein